MATTEESGLFKNLGNSNQLSWSCQIPSANSNLPSYERTITKLVVDILDRAKHKSQTI